MGHSLGVVTSELRLAADRLRGSGQRLQDGLSSIDFETGNLLASGWKGDAAKAFSKYWEQWHQGAGQVVRGLQTMADLLAASADEYDATDARSASVVSSTVQGKAGSGGAGPASPGAGGAPTQGGPATPSGAVAGSPQQAEMTPADPGQAMQPLPQLGQQSTQLAGGLTQAIQQAVQVASGVAQQAAQTEPQDDAAPAETTDAVDAPAGAAGGEVSAGAAPVDAPARDESESEIVAGGRP